MLIRFDQPMSSTAQSRTMIGVITQRNGIGDPVTKNFSRCRRNAKLYRRCAKTETFASGISQQIGILERELRTPLLVRSNKFVRLTEGGEILLQCAGQVLDNLERVRVLLAEQSNTDSGRLSVAVPATFCHWLLPRLIDRFHERFPAIQVSVVMTDVDIAADRVAHREIDIALLPTGLQHKALALAPLGKDELVAAISRANPLAAKQRILAVDLKEQRFIMPSSGNLRFVPWDRFLINSGLFPRIIVETDDLELAKHLAGQNVGITIVPRWSVNGEIARGECAALPIGPHGFTATGIWRITTPPSWPVRHAAFCGFALRSCRGCSPIADVRLSRKVPATPQILHPEDPRIIVRLDARARL